MTATTPTPTWARSKSTVTTQLLGACARLSVWAATSCSPKSSASRGIRSCVKTSTRGEIFKARYLPRIRTFPGVRALLGRMAQGGLNLIASSSAKEDELAALLELAGVDDMLTERTSSSDAEATKPSPDVLTAALQKLDVPAEAAILLGDTPYDLQAAGALGVGFVALRCGGWGDADFRGALAVYDDPQDLLEHYGASPFAEQAVTDGWFAERT